MRQMISYDRPQEGWNSRRFLLPISFALLFVLITLAFLNSPEASRGFAWFRDGGLVLDTANQLVHGKKLYSDLFYQYGPLPITLYSQWSRAFGVSVNGFYSFIVPVLLLKSLLLFGVLQASRLSIFTVIIILLAVVLSPIRSFFLPDLTLYSSFEDAMTLSAILLWKPPDNRSFRHGLAFGAVIGTMQWIRFGAASGLLVAVFCLDLVFTKLPLRSFAKQTASYLFGFLGIELVLAASLFATRAKDIALDVLWPFYMAGSYEGAYTVSQRFPRLTSLHIFIGTQMTPVACGLLALIGLVIIVRQRTPTFDSRLLILVIAYLFNAAFYYKHVFHYYGGYWMVCLAAATAIDRSSLRLKSCLLVLFLPGLYVGVRSVLPHQPSSAAYAAILPNGERLWLPQHEISTNQLMVDGLTMVRHDPSRDGVLFVSRTLPTVASHFYFFYGLSQPNRHSMIFPGWLRQRDFNSLPKVLGRSKALVLLQNADQGTPAANACSWESHPYPHPFCDFVTQNLINPIKVDNTCWIFPVKQD